MDRNYSWGSVVREEVDVRQFMELQRQAEALYTSPARFLDLIRRKPRRWQPPS